MVMDYGLGAVGRWLLALGYRLEVMGNDEKNETAIRLIAHCSKPRAKSRDKVAHRLPSVCR